MRLDVVWLAGVAALFTVGCGSAHPDDAGSTQEMISSSGELSMPVQVEASAAASSCQNAPGPYVTLDGNVSLGGFGVRIIFTNNAKFTHETVDDIKADVVVVPVGESITIPKQPSQGGSGGNPFIWIEFLDGQGNAVSDEIFLGRCVQGLSNVDTRVSMPIAFGIESASATDCSNNPGPYVTLNGRLTLSGFTARFIFRNNDNPVGGPHETDVLRSADLAIIPPGETVQIPKQPVLGGSGGNPWIYVEFIDGTGQPISSPKLLGRCVQLQRGN